MLNQYKNIYIKCIFHFLNMLPYCFVFLAKLAINVKFNFGFKFLAEINYNIIIIAKL